MLARSAARILIKRAPANESAKTKTRCCCFGNLFTFFSSPPSPLRLFISRLSAVIFVACPRANQLRDFQTGFERLRSNSAISRAKVHHFSIDAESALRFPSLAVFTTKRNRYNSRVSFIKQAAIWKTSSRRFLLIWSLRQSKESLLIYKLLRFSHSITSNWYK